MLLWGGLLLYSTMTKQVEQVLALEQGLVSVQVLALEQAAQETETEEASVL